MSTISPAEPTTVAQQTPPAPQRLARRERWLVSLAAGGAFIFAAVPIGMLLYLAQVEEMDIRVVLLAAGMAGSLFALTFGMITYLILKPWNSTFPAAEPPADDIGQPVGG